jgi:predicted ester cyclase
MVGYFSQIFRSFPDYAPTIDLMMAKNDLVMVYLTWRGTNTGEPFLGVEPTGTQVVTKPVTFFASETEELSNTGMWSIARVC